MAGALPFVETTNYSMTKDEQWQVSIGRLIYSFGFIELYLNQLLTLWLDQEVYEHIEKNPLSDRLKLAKNIAPIRCPDDAFLARVVANLDDIKGLCERRNIVAHNPVILHAKRLSDGKWDMKDVVGKNKRMLTLSDIHDAGQRAEIARNELIAIVGDCVRHIMVTAEGVNEPRLKGAAKLLNAEIAGVAATP